MKKICRVKDILESEFTSGIMRSGCWQQVRNQIYWYCFTSTALSKILSGRITTTYMWI